MSENEIRVLYVQPGKYPEERIMRSPSFCLLKVL